MRRRQSYITIFRHPLPLLMRMFALSVSKCVQWLAADTTRQSSASFRICTKLRKGVSWVSIYNETNSPHPMQSEEDVNAMSLSFHLLHVLPLYSSFKVQIPRPRDPFSSTAISLIIALNSAVRSGVVQYRLN